jgi:hypothetical protein
MRSASRVAALLAATAMASCQLIIGLDDYYLAPACPVGAALCTLCNDAADCGPADACHTWSCVEHLCQPIDATAGTACSGGVCSDVSPSTCVPCNEDADCLQPGGHCYEHACFRCDDGVENGDELEVDCGGACPECLGLPCSIGSDCKSGFCADGRCCNAPCDAICMWCFDGDCKNVPQYESDTVPACIGNNVCNGGGECRLDNGSPCVADVECASGKCVNMTCTP